MVKEWKVLGVLSRVCTLFYLIVIHLLVYIYIYIYIYIVAPIPTLAPNEFNFERHRIKISIKVPEENFKIYAHSLKCTPYTCTLQTLKLGGYPLSTVGKCLSLKSPV